MKIIIRIIIIIIIIIIIKIEAKKVVIGSFNSILWTRNIMKTELLIYKAIVESILISGAETWI